MHASAHHIHFEEGEDPREVTSTHLIDHPHDPERATLRIGKAVTPIANIHGSLDQLAALGDWILKSVDAIRTAQRGEAA